MQFALLLPIFVTFVLSLISAKAFADGIFATTEGQYQPRFTFTLKAAGEDVLTEGASPNASFSTGLEYHFYKAYNLGVEFSYYSPYTQFEDYIYNGLNDMALYVSDKELWASRYWNVSLTGKLSLILPTSQASQAASINWGASESLILKKGFGDRFNVTYTLIGNEYDCKYATAWESDTITIYNTQLDVVNRLALAYSFEKDLRIVGSGQVRTFNNYNDETYNIYRLGGGLAVDLDKYVTLETSIFSSMKNASAPPTWNGPYNSDHFFDAKGTIFVVGMLFKI